MLLFNLKNVSISYDQTIVLAKVSLTIESGERIALLGKSGSGKSTLLRYLYAQSEELSSRNKQYECAWAPQAPALSQALTVYHNVYMGRLGDYPAWRNVWNLIRPFADNVSDIKSLLRTLRLEDKCFTKVSDLSGGQQQRTGLARALYQKKPILLVDEPVSAVDEYQAEEIIQSLQSFSQTIILGLHDSYLALNHCDRIIGLKDGNIIVDAPTSQLVMADLASLYQ